MMEVFLSVDAPHDAIAFFREQISSVEADSDKLAHAIALTQLLLLEDRREEYLDLLAKWVVPLLDNFPNLNPNLFQGRTNPIPNATDFTNMIVSVGICLSLVPACRTDFLDDVPDTKIGELVQKLEATQKDKPETNSELLVDILLLTLHERLGSDQDERKTLERLRSNPARVMLIPGKQDDNIRDQVHQFTKDLVDLVR